MAQAGKLQVLATRMALQEAEDNIEDRLGPAARTRYYRELAATNPEIVDPPTEEELARWASLVVTKDLHVLAGAFKGSADVLVTLDRKHILTEPVRNGFPIPVQGTREFFAALRAERERHGN